MSTPYPTDLDSTAVRKFFFEQAQVELKRAERYRVFVSLVVLDVSSAKKIHDASLGEIISNIENMVRGHIRGCDYVSFCGETCLMALFPETSRQGAEIAGRRLSDAVRARVQELSGGQIDEVVPLEMASFPDAAGARSVSALLSDLADRSRN
jgi:GGDEF domain-containing protein